MVDTREARADLAGTTAIADGSWSRDLAASSTRAIDVYGLCRSYGTRQALADISAGVEGGETLAVFGANGAGKTTFLRVLATLLRPHAGTVRVLSQELPKDAYKLRGKVGYLGHDPLLYRQLTARENLRFNARLLGVDYRRVDELLEQVGMAKRAREPVSDLSRGLVQRVAVARAVLADPPLLLLDEPRANLDPAASEALEPLIGRASARTRVLCTHDVDAALAECDVALGLRQGRQAFFGRCEADQVRDLYR